MIIYIRKPEGVKNFMELFIPKKVLFEPAALDYKLGKDLFNFFNDKGIPIGFTRSHNRVTGISGDTPQEVFLFAKQTLVVGVKRTKKLESCSPSAHYQLPIATSCPARCQYCYLQTTLGNKPYIRIYVNIDEILKNAEEYIKRRLPEITVFELSSTADPLSVEHFTGSVAKAIAFFGQQPHGRLRVATKFTNVDDLLDIVHNGHTRFRFSVNHDDIIKVYEHGTNSLEERIIAAKKMVNADYPIGFIIAPIFWEENWKEKYRELLSYLAKEFNTYNNLTFELITHRFTKRAKNVILNRFPNTKLDMEEENRSFRYGKFGYGKYVYTPEKMKEMKDYFYEEIYSLFPNAIIEYFI